MLITQLADWTQDMWGAIIGLFGFIPNWGWMIIVFTIVLKLVLSPLDYWQKKLARNNAKKQAALQPELAKIQQKYGANRQILNQKTMELYKREGYHLGGSCVGMLVSLALTMFIFFTLFSGLMGMSRTQILNQYNSMQSEYNQAFCTEYSITEDQIPEKQNELWSLAVEQAKAETGKTEVDDEVYTKALEILALDEKIARIQEVVASSYETKYKQSFLWIKNLWSPDTNSAAFKNFNEFAASSGLYNTPEFLAQIKNKTAEEIKAIKEGYRNQYNFTTYKLQQNYKNTWNGYFILVVLAAVITYFSMVISQMQSTKHKKGKDQPAPAGMGGLKFMKFLLPILMVIFTIGYSAAFALYIITNSLMSLILSYVFLAWFEHREKNQPQTSAVVKPNKYRPDYSRENIIDATATKVEDNSETKIVTPPKQKPMEYRKDFLDKPNKPKK